MSAATTTVDSTRARPADAIASWSRRNAWVLGLIGLMVLLLLFTKAIQPRYAPIPLQGLGTSVLPLALAAVAQAVVVIGGGIELSIGSVIGLTSVVSAALMKGQPDATTVVIVIGVLVLGLLIGAANGGLVMATRVPDIVVTLAMSFVWAGIALIIAPRPGGGAPAWFKSLAVGPFLNEWVPRAF